MNYCHGSVQGKRDVQDVICASYTLVEGGAGSVNRNVDIIINNVAKNIRAQNCGFYIQGCN